MGLESLDCAKLCSQCFIFCTVRIATIILYFFLEFKKCNDVTCNPAQASAKLMCSILLIHRSPTVDTGPYNFSIPLGLHYNNDCIFSMTLACPNLSFPATVSKCCFFINSSWIDLKFRIYIPVCIM